MQADYRDMKSVRGDDKMFCANMHKTIALREEWIAKYGVRALIDAYETVIKNGGKGYVL
tara:strand:+ start:315 stop:491 length:177 start_codon:yes stop_codon:yes gene_type:complete